MLGYINSMRRRPDGASHLSGVVGKMKLSEMKIGVPSKIVQVRLDDADKIDVQPLAEGESVAKAAVRPVGGKV